MCEKYVSIDYYPRENEQQNICGRNTAIILYIIYSPKVMLFDMENLIKEYDYKYLLHTLKKLEI